MSSILLRGSVVTMAVLALLGADIAMADETPERVRLPVGRLAHEEDADRVTVVEGDHLWKISKRHLEARLRRTPSDPEIGPYWRRVIDENVESLRSGDPDLIYPGEVIELPAPGLSGPP